MMKKRYAVPALILGVALLGGSTAYAFGGPGMIDTTEAFTSFSSDEQAAIKKAAEIRAAAEEEAKAVLEAAGITQDELRDAMQTYGEKQRETREAALESGDYEAFKALGANGPMADELTEEVFNTLVEAHTLMEAGDHDGARALLEDAGMQGPGGMGGHGPRSK